MFDVQLGKDSPDGATLIFKKSGFPVFDVGIDTIICAVDREIYKFEIGRENSKFSCAVCFEKFCCPPTIFWNKQAKGRAILEFIVHKVNVPRFFSSAPVIGQKPARTHSL